MNIDRYKRQLAHFRHRIRQDPMYDIRELLEIEQRQWGPRMRRAKNEGDPVAGLGFAGVVVPNNVPVTNVTSTSSTNEINLLMGGTAGTIPAYGVSPSWMWIPAGNMRGAQSWRYYAAGVFTTNATNSGFTFTNRIGLSTTASANASFAATGVVTANVVVSAAPWWQEGHMTVRSMGGAGALGTLTGSLNLDLANASVAITNSISVPSVTPTALTVNVDTTVPVALCTDVACQTTGNSIQLTQFMIVAWD